jgi:hypothetical protein
VGSPSEGGLDVLEVQQRWVGLIDELEREVDPDGRWEPWGGGRLPDGTADPEMWHGEELWDPLIGRWSPALTRAYQLTVFPVGHPDWGTIAYVEYDADDPTGPIGLPEWRVRLGLCVPDSDQGERDAIGLLGLWLDGAVDEAQTRQAAERLQRERDPRPRWRRLVDRWR